MKVVKGKSREPRECFMIEDGRHILPKGIYFIKRIQGEYKYKYKSVPVRSLGSIYKCVKRYIVKLAKTVTGIENKFKN